ncbi:MAG: metallophosphoesterase family protein [Rhodothermales bacterium]
MGLIAIGDVHGCATSMEALIAKIAPGTDDHLIFVGDYIDRGPDSRRVIESLLDLSQHVRCTFLRGNHEALMLNYLDRGEFDLWRMNGGVETLNSYRSDAGSIEIPQSHIDFIRGTTLYHDEPKFFFVHAGLRPDLTIAENIDREDEHVFLWERGHLQARSLKWEKPVVCGHTPHSEPINEEKLILIDTGCVYHNHPMMGRLTAVRLPERDFVSVDYQG